MADTFFIADTHFYHDKVILYEKRPFRNVEEMNRTLIENWNRMVKRLDKVYVLGDFCFHPKQYVKELCDALNGYKILVMGNHDTVSHRFYLESGFEEVSKYPIILENRLLLSHYPMETNDAVPYVNLFGHIHGNPSHKDDAKRGLCVCVERPHMAYRPISLERVKMLMGLE